MTKGPVTLEQVAAAAGISTSTASRALAGKARECRISAKTEEAIIQAARGLGFQPSHVARSLRNHRSGLIGLLVPDASNPFFSAIARTATLHMERQGMSTLLADSHDSLDHEIDLLKHLLSRRVEGLIICSIGGDGAHLKSLENQSTNVVLIDRCIEGLEIPTITSDNVRGGFLATNAILDQGHQKIGCLQGLPGTSTNEERLRGYRDALRQYNIQPDETLIRGDDFSEESGYRSTCELIEMHPDMTALFAFNNQNALGALRALSEHKLQIPQDVSLVMFDDTPFASFLSSPLCVIRQDVEAIGRTAVELLLEQMNTGHKTEKTVHRIPVEMVMRDSIATPQKRSQFNNS